MSASFQDRQMVPLRFRNFTVEADRIAWGGFRVERLFLVQVFVAGKFWFSWRLRVRGIVVGVHSCMRRHRACVSSVNHDNHDNNDDNVHLQK